MNNYLIRFYKRLFFTRILIALFFITDSLVVEGQNKEEYFKTIPLLTDDTPDWAILMYSDDPKVYEVYDAYNNYYKDIEFEKTTHTQNFKYWIRKVESHIDIEGYIRPQKEKKKRKKEESTNLRGLTNKWEAIGPFETYRDGIPVSWQAYVSSIDVCESNPSIAYAGSFGLYKTTDKGDTWFPITYDLDFRAVERVAVAPSNPDIVYFASQSGLWKSTDGNTFTKILTSISACNKIEIHPTNPDILMIASNEGLQRSDNGGLSWETIKPEICWDIDFHPTDPTIVYATFNNPIAIKSEFWKSINTGNNFSLQHSGWYDSTDPDRSDGGSRIAVTAADPDKVYVGLLGNSKAGDNNWIGVYRSDDIGESWINPSGQDGSPYYWLNSLSWNVAAYGGDQGVQQGFYNFDIAASNTDPDKIWIGTIRLAESSDGGESFFSIGGDGTIRLSHIHADVQEIVVVEDEIWVASDGGVNFSNDELQSHSSKKYGINGADYWGYSSGKDLDIMVGGTYHNGNNARHPDYGDKNFQYIGGSESPTGYVDGADNTRLHCSDIWSCLISTNENVNESTLYSILNKYPNESYVKSQSSEIVYDINTPATCYLGNGADFYKSTNSGANFNSLYNFGNGKVYEIEQSQQNVNKFYLIFHNNDNTYTERGEIYKTTNGGNSWSKVMDIPSTNHHLLEISINPNNDEELWVANTVGGIGEKIYRTIDGGNSWTNETTSLIENVILNDIIYISATASNSQDRVYILSDKEVHFKNVADDNWQDITDGLPLAFLPNRFAYFPSEQLLRIATRGHGIWELDITYPCNLQASMEMYRTCSTNQTYIGVEVDGVSDYDFLWSDGVESTCNTVLTQGAELMANEGQQLITDFCQTEGIHYVDLELFTDCSNQEASFKAIVNTLENTISVLEYIPFGLTNSSPMMGDGTNTVLSDNNTTQIEFLLSANILYLDLVDTPCADNATVRIQNGNTHLTKEVTTIGNYSTTISSGTNCERIETLNVENISVLNIEPISGMNCNSTVYTGFEIDGTNNFNFTYDGVFLGACSENYANAAPLYVNEGNQLISDFCDNTEGEFYVDLEVITGCYNTISTFKGIIDLNNDIIVVEEYIHFDGNPSAMIGDGTATVTSSSAAYAEYQLILSNDQLYLNHTAQPCGNTFIKVNNASINPNTCPQIYSNGNNLTLNDAEQLITDFCKIPGIYYVDLEFFTNCNDKEASFKGIVNTNLNIIEVFEYMHFGANIASEMIGNTSNSVSSSDTNYSQIELSVADNKLYLDVESIDCGATAYVKILNGNSHLAHEVNSSGTYSINVMTESNCTYTKLIEVDTNSCDDNDPCTINDQYDANCNCIGDFLDSDNDNICDANEFVSFQLKVFLQGALFNSSNDNLMRDDLRANNYLPTIEPYSSITYFNHYGNGGGETISNSMLVDNDDNSIVDWVLVELRDKINPSNIIATKSALLQKNGTVVDINGNNVLIFNINKDDYHVAIRHRNHLGAMTLNPLELNENMTIDFSDANFDTWGENARVLMSNGVYALWGGNSIMDNQIIFQGVNNDVNASFFTVLQAPSNTNNSPIFIEHGYHEGDIDMDGKCIFQGVENEPNFVFFNVLSFPTNINTITNVIINEQLP